METITVTTVSGPNERGWYKVALGDGRETDTKDEKIVQAARKAAAEGAEVEAKINESKRGKFTTLYLNELAGVGEERPTGAAKTPSTPGRSYGGKDQATQDRINHQWALGRAVELLMASGEEFTLPLDDATKSKLETTAGYLRDQTK